MNELPPSEENEVRVLEHRSVILGSLWKASDMKTCVYIQTIALLDLRDLLIMTIGVLGAALQLPAEAFPFDMAPAPGQGNDGAGVTNSQQPTGAAPLLGPPPGQPAFGPPFVPPPPHAAPVYTQEQLRQLSQFYTPEQLAHLLPHVSLQSPAEPAPASDTPKAARAPRKRGASQKQ